MMANEYVAGKLAAITGAADGIGKAIALKLAEHGCHIALIDINGTKLDQLCRHLQSLYASQRFHSFVCDASDQSSVAKLPDLVRAAFKTSSLQLLFNNVGIASNTHSVLSGDIAKLRFMMDVNLWSMMYGTRAFLPMLMNNDATTQCYIFNTGSIASIESGSSMYSVTKHAVIALSETIRAELQRMNKKHAAPSNILVSTIVPAFVATNIHNTSAEMLQEESPDKTVWNTNMGKIIARTQIDVNVVADLVFELGIKQKKCVIPTHFEWHEAVIKDRMTALLNLQHDNKALLRKEIKKTMTGSKSKL